MNKIIILVIVVVSSILFFIIGTKWIDDWDKNRNIKFLNRIKAFILASAWFAITTYLVILFTETI